MALYPVEIDLAPGFGWQGAPEFNTLIRVLQNGHERRNARASQVRHRYTLPFQNITSDTYLLSIKSAFLSVRGQLHAFLVKDHSDYRATAEPLGAAPAGTAAVQLKKTSTFGTASYDRTITRPVSAGFTMYQNTGSGPVAKPGTLDTATGLFTPSSAWATLPTPVISTVTTATTGGTLAAGTYSYRVSATNASGQTLASTAVTVTTTGATSANTVNWAAITGATGFKVYGRAGGAEQLIATLGAVTSYTDTGSITPSGALPTTNTTIAQLSWTGEFRVPVRFASDSLPMSIDDRFGAGGAYAMNGSIELIEVFGE